MGSSSIIKKESNIGGEWFTAANKGSRVQILEPGYRLIPGKIATDFTQQEEVLENLNEIVNQLLQKNGENKIYVNSTCTKVDNIDDKVFIHSCLEIKDQTTTTTSSLSETTAQGSSIAHRRVHKAQNSLP